MQASLKALFTDVLDYAGIFPPAELSLQTAIRNYNTYRASEHVWMLGRFVCPASRLAELMAWEDGWLAGESPYRFSILLGRSGNGDTYLREVTADLAVCRGF